MAMLVASHQLVPWSLRTTPPLWVVYVFKRSWIAASSEQTRINIHQVSMIIPINHQAILTLIAVMRKIHKLSYVEALAFNQWAQPSNTIEYGERRGLARSTLDSRALFLLRMA